LAEPVGLELDVEVVYAGVVGGHGKMRDVHDAQVSLEILHEADELQGGRGDAEGNVDGIERRIRNIPRPGGGRGIGDRRYRLRRAFVGTAAGGSLGGNVFEREAVTEGHAVQVDDEADVVDGRG